MSAHNNAGQILGASSAVGGVSVLPLTGGSPFMIILPLVAITCGSIVLISLTVIRLKEKQETRS